MLIKMPIKWSGW